MSKWLLRVLALCVALMVFISTVAFAAPYNTPIGEAETPSGVESYFDAAVLIDLSTNSELYSKDADRVFTPVGGAVNLMAAYIVWQEAEWEREIPIIEDVLELSPSSRKLELRPGSRWLIKDLTAGMLLHGAQDASLVLCDHVAGSQESFVQLMNDYAQELGMANTVYMNPLGAYAEGQATTASDMLLLARAIAEIGALRDLLGGSEYDAINGQAIQHRMAIMHESSPNYDERVKGFTEGSTATAGTNTLLYAVEGERACLFIGYKEIDDQLGCQNAAAALIDFFLDAYTLFDASAIVGQLLEEKPISFESGAVVTLAMAEANCSILVENSV